MVSTSAGWPGAHAIRIVRPVAVVVRMNEKALRRLSLLELSGTQRSNNALLAQCAGRLLATLSPHFKVNSM